VRSLSLLTAAMNVSDLSAAQLRRAASIKERIEKLHKELTSILGTAAPASTAPNGRTEKRKLSAAARALISAAQKKRWARLKRATPAATVKPARKKKFTMSAAAKAAISKAAKARWAKIKAARKQ
jgi:hypothetical protein